MVNFEDIKEIGNCVSHVESKGTLQKFLSTLLRYMGGFVF